MPSIPKKQGHTECGLCKVFVLNLSQHQRCKKHILAQLEAYKKIAELYPEKAHIYALYKEDNTTYRVSDNATAKI